VSDERTESESERNGRSDSIAKEGCFSGDSVPRPLGFIAWMPIPVNQFCAGAQFSPNPSLVLAPESALSLLPNRGLSSAPAARSVSATAVLRNGGTKKELDYRSAFRHGPYRMLPVPTGISNTFVTPSSASFEGG